MVFYTDPYKNLVNYFKVHRWGSLHQLVTVKNMGVDHCCFHSFMPKELLDCPYIVALFQKAGGKKSGTSTAD
jgi:hypothetical protein